ncbi:28S ribosomal protein S18c-like protein [Leptotrombidium deliense]|uniref:28S ribosomal protein S18c-like protein n=1 Tax=Leptotrombidium deliense TaxID=299467 RepID=A0A443S2B2_9ACAR|nr:28S ribosomal protein S18c-like protein [Leptotrombidium deliense]
MNCFSIICSQPTPNMENPYKKEKKQCILCKYGVQLDYKNPRLLSQFVSPFTGRVYDKHITGLCEKQQQILKAELWKSQRSGFMPYIYRDPRFANDPKLFNPMRPQRPNPH